MESAEFLEIAEYLKDNYLEILNVDPITNISLKIDDQIPKPSICTKLSSSPLSWEIALNLKLHNDLDDIQYSIVDSLVRILFEREFEFIDLNTRQKLAIENVITRLVPSFNLLLPLDIDEEEEEEDDYDE